MHNTEQNPLQIIRIEEASTLFGLARSSFYERMKQGLIPKQISLGGRSVGWLLCEVTTVLKVWIRGDTEEEIKLLVIDLTKTRQKLL